MTRPGVAAVLLALLLTAGCTGGGDRAGAADRASQPPSPLADCAGLTESRPDPPAGAAGDPLPELTLPCLTGGEPFRLAGLRGPAVVNLWASWCPPCRAELPELQGYADQAAGRVHVLGVVTEDRRSAAVALATDLGLRFPALADRDGELRRALGMAPLPVTLLVDAAGRVRHVHRGPPLDRPELAGLVREHLGVGT